MLTKEQAGALVAKTLKFSSFPDCTVSISEEEVAYMRFANNGLTSSAVTLEHTVSVTSTRNFKTGGSSTTDLSDESLKATVRRSEEIAAFAPANPEYMEPLSRQKYPDYENWDESTAHARPAQMIGRVKSVISSAVAKKLIAAGYFERTTYTRAFANKRGNSGHQRGTDSRLATTIRNSLGTSSGWASHPSVRISEIDGPALAARAIDKCLRWSGKPIRLEPGKYTVVLEPTAVGDVVAAVGPSLSARSAEQGQSFLSKKGGGTLVGSKLFPEIVTLRTDPMDRRYPTSIWSTDALPSGPVTWIDKGVVKNLVYDRYWASQTGATATTAANYLVLEGGGATVADLVKATDRGLLVTRFWYIRSVNPQTIQLTGLTRDGLFLIEKGEITSPVMNLRFTESVVRILQNTAMVSESIRVRGAESTMIAPAIQAHDFIFTSISDAV